MKKLKRILFLTMIPLIAASSVVVTFLTKSSNQITSNNINKTNEIATKANNFSLKKSIDNTILNQISSSSNVFNSIETKFANEYYSSKPIIAQYKQQAVSDLTDLMNNNPSSFVDGTFLNNSSTLVDPNKTLTIAQNNSNENELLVSGNFLTNNNSYQWNQFIITGFNLESTSVINISHSIKDTSLSNLIPEEAILKKTEIKEFIQNNISSIFSSIPNNTSVINIECKINPNENNSILVSAYLNKYALNGVVKYINTGELYENIKVNGFTVPNPNETKPKTIQAASIYNLLDSSDKNSFFQNLAKKFSFELVNNAQYASEFKTLITKAINNDKNANIWFENAVLSSSNPKKLPMIKNNTSLDIKNESNSILITGEFLRQSKNPNYDLDENSYERMTIRIEGFNAESTKVINPVNISSYSQLSNMIVDDVLQNKTILLNFIKSNKDLFFSNYSNELEVQEIQQINASTDSEIAVDLTLKYRNYVVNGLLENNQSQSSRLVITGFTQPNKLETSGKTISNIELNRITSSTSVWNGIENKFAYDFTNNPGTELNEKATNELIEFINSGNYNSLFFNNPIDPSSNPNNLSIIKQNSNLNISILKSSNKWSSIIIYGEFLSRPKNPNKPLDNSDYKQMQITITGFKTDPTKVPSNIPIVNDNELKKLIPEQAINVPEKIQLYVQNNINSFLENIGYYTTISIIQDSLKISTKDQRAIEFKITANNVYGTNGEFLSSKTFDCELTGFNLPNTNVTSTIPQTTSSIKNNVTSDNFLYTLSDKYVLELERINSESNSLKSSLTALINSNPELFLNHPIDQSLNTNKLPTVKNLSFSAKLSSSNIYDRIKVTGDFLTQSRNNNDIITENNYKQLSFEITGFKTDETSINANSISVTGQLANLIASEAIDQSNLILEFVKNNLYKIFNNLPQQSVSVVKVENFVIQSDRTSISLDVTINRWFNNQADIITSNKTFSNIILKGFLTPNKNPTTAKTVNVLEILSLPNLSEFMKKLNTYYASELAENGNLNNQAITEFINFINTNPSTFFNNPVTSTQNPNNIPVVSGSINIVAVKNSNSNQYSNLSITGNFLAQPENPNGTVSYNNYKTMTINIIGFRTGQTKPNSKGASISGKLADMTANEAKEYVDDIQEFINENVSNLLQDSLSNTTIEIAKRNSIPLISVVNDTLSITVNVTNYVDEVSNVIYNSPIEMKVIIKGFSVQNDKVTIPKTVMTNFISDVVETDNFLKNLPNMFAIDLVSSDNIYGTGSNYQSFNQNLINLINQNPNIFFEDPVTIENNANNLSYVKKDTQLTITIATKSNIKDYTSVNVQGYFLVQPNNANANVSEKNYELLTIQINNFNSLSTTVSTNSTILGYQYTKGDTVIIPSDYSVNDFLYNNSFSDLVSTKEILTDYVKTNIFQLFNNLPQKYEFIDIVSIELDNDDYSAILLNVTMKNVSSGNGILDNTNKNFSIKIAGFQPPKDNPNITSVKSDISITTLKETYANESNLYPLLSNLSKHHAEEYTLKGYYNSMLINEITESINSNPSLWFINPVTNSQNPQQLPIVNKNVKLNIQIDPSNPDSVLYITGSFLCQPSKANVPVNEINDYKEFTISINNGQGTDTFYNAGATTLNQNYADTNFEHNSNQMTLNLKNGYFSNSILSNVNIDDIEVSNSESSKKTLSSEFQKLIKHFFDDSNNRIRIFNNVLNSNYTTVLFKPSWESDSSSISYEFNYQTKILTIDVYLKGYYDSSGSFIETQMPLPFKISFYGFSNANNEVLNQSNKYMDIIFYGSIGGGILIILLITLLVLLNLKKKKSYSDEYYDGFKE